MGKAKNDFDNSSISGICRVSGNAWLLFALIALIGAGQAMALNTQTDKAVGNTLVGGASNMTQDLQTRKEYTSHQSNVWVVSLGGVVALTGYVCKAPATVFTAVPQLVTCVVLAAATTGWFLFGAIQAIRGKRDILDLYDDDSPIKISIELARALESMKGNDEWTDLTSLINWLPEGQSVYHYGGSTINKQIISVKQKPDGISKRADGESADTEGDVTVDLVYGDINTQSGSRLSGNYEDITELTAQMMTEFYNEHNGMPQASCFNFDQSDKSGRANVAAMIVQTSATGACQPGQCDSYYSRCEDTSSNGEPDGGF